MGKVITYMGIIFLALILFHISGVMPEGTPISIILDALLHPENLQQHSLTSSLTVALGLLAVGSAILVGLFAPQLSELAIMVGFTSVLLGIGWEMIALFSVVAQLNRSLAIIIISPFMILFLISLIEWWRGLD